MRKKRGRKKKVPGKLLENVHGRDILKSFPLFAVFLFIFFVSKIKNSQILVI